LAKSGSQSHRRKKWLVLVELQKKKGANRGAHTPRERAASPPAVAPERAQIRQAENDLKDREARYRDSSQKLTSDLRLELQRIKRVLSSTSDLQSVVIIAKAVRELIPQIESARKYLPNLPPLKSPNLVGNEDPITKVKKSTLPRVLELENIIDSVIVLITGSAGLEQLLEFSGIISPCLSVLQGVTTALNLS